MRLELDAVTAAYGDAVAVRSATLTVPEGTVVALLGPNGAGKTTLLSVASGLLRARSGAVRIDGEDITSWAADRRARAGICHITEGRSIFPSLTVRDNLRLFGAAADEGDAIERAVAAFPRLGERINQVAGTMSGGEQQMVALARAYATRAPVVLLDEVSLGLAPIVVDEIFLFLERLRAQGTSLLLVEQYVGKALALADHVYLLVRGGIVFAGEPAEIGDGVILQTYLGEEAVPV